MPTLHTTDVKSFECYGLDCGEQNAKYVVTAEQTSRPYLEAGVVVGHHLEWQFYCEQLHLILVRKSDEEFAAIDDPQRVFASAEREQAAYQ